MPESALSLYSSAGVAAAIPMLRDALQRQRLERLEQLEEINATMLVERSYVDLALENAASTALGEIDAALGRMEDGRYGRCDTCDADIPVERLTIRPMAYLCARCQARLERLR